MRPKPFVLVILDGVGLAPPSKNNAVSLAKMPNFDRLWMEYPHTKLKAFGTAVGLEKGYIGGSEVGHLHIGAGRIVPQELKTINNSIHSGQFYKNPAFLEAIRKVKKNNSRLHIIGLLSDGGVHSDYSHLHALLKLAKKHDVSQVYIHAFLDGRDKPPRSAAKYLLQLEKWMRAERVGKLATIIGRAYAMDRANRWLRTRKAYNLLFKGDGKQVSVDPVYLVKKYYKKGYRDEYFPPVIFDKNGIIRDGDAVIDFNYRADRMLQLVTSIVSKRFLFFHRKKPNITFVAMSPYSKRFKTLAAFPHPFVSNNLGEVISKAGLSQLRIAEKEKFVHVTFFFNGDSDVQFEGESRQCVPSRKVKTYDRSPAMSSREITNILIRKLPQYDFIVVNYANGDMLGHTGNIKAAIKGLEVLDRQLGRLIKKVKSLGGEAIITADHGNCDEMGPEMTAHSKNPVPFIVVSERKVQLKKKGGLANVAPTILQLLRLKKPKEMTAQSLIV